MNTVSAASNGLCGW